jgi:hypothetical protein
MVDGVGVGEEPELPVSRLGELVAGPMLAEPTGGEGTAGDNPQAAILGGERAGKVTGAIGGGVVKYQHFQVRILLGQEGANAGEEVVGLVAGGEQDGGRGQGSGWGKRLETREGEDVCQGDEEQPAEEDENAHLEEEQEIRHAAGP